MKKLDHSILKTILILLLAFLIFEIIKDAFRTGDFIGYVNAGNLVLNGENIYSDYLNTWPPFFAVLSVGLAFGDQFNSFLIRFIWLFGTLIAMYYTMTFTVKMVLKDTLNYKGKGILFHDPIILIPLLIIFPFILHNLGNIQINIYMLLCVTLCLFFFIRKQYFWLGCILALTISIKIYTIFFLFYFIYKREFIPVAWTFGFLILFNSIPLFVFGFDQAIEYYQYWLNEVVPRSYIANHKNQSIFGAFLRFFTNEDPTHDLYINVLNENPHHLKLFTYGLIATIAIIPAFLFRKRLKPRDSLHAFLEYAFIFNLIPLLSPLSWKAYFIFLWLPYFLTYNLLFKANTSINERIIKRLKLLFYSSLILNIGSAEIFVGQYVSDLLEAYSVLTFGTLILLIIQLVLYVKIDFKQETDKLITAAS